MSFITFGETMLRLTPGNHATKIRSSQHYQASFAGSESNVASSLGVLGNQVDHITKLPNNQLGEAAIASLQSYGISTKYIVRGGKRIGTYFIEVGSSIRPSSVIYDRSNSSISEIGTNEFYWEEILENKKWIFLSGITPVLSKQCTEETIKAAEVAKQKGVKVAFDMNYRRSLWNDPADARKIFDQILEHTDLLFGNYGVLKDVYDLTIVGDSELDRTIEASTIASEKFGIKRLAFTVRKHISASQNKVSAIYLANSKHHISKPIDVHITDRFGTGDAFAAATLHGINCDWNDKRIVDFATAAFALKHTIQGDQHISSEKEILSIMEGNTGGHVLR
ncbi:sugar kinase [Arenibacter palladensis]|uniref:sugar kinase n=1 Tax=Arenibacter palladensis TaxID=237373 RepID=UPI0026E46363|nr:sugar kinase [Arenibacter palladensis]MDO6602863.1 sugar kinase [Arenibacter palladensis]